MFCPSCGTAIKKSFKFCPQCSFFLSNHLPSPSLSDGQTSFSNMPSSSSSQYPLHSTPVSLLAKHSSNEEQDTLPSILPKFSHFLATKSEERQSMSYRPKLKSLKKIEKDEVTISIGLMESKFIDGKSIEYSISRGKVLPLKVRKVSGSQEILQAALKKRTDFDKSFRRDKIYKLSYPDATEVIYIPGTKEEFKLVKYKEELGKPYGRITLYLCCQINTDSVGQESDSSDEDVTSRSFTLPLEPSFGDSNQPSTSAKVFVAMVRCPICNQKFSKYDIEVHADACLNSKTNPFMCFESNTDDDFDLHDPEELNEGSPQCLSPSHGLELLNTENPQELKLAISTAIRSAVIEDTSNHLQISVRRGFSFADFKSFFSKSWNKRQQNKPYHITYIGESGVDTGGISRDFYAEALQEVKCQHFAGTEDEGYEPLCGLVSIADGTVQTIGHLFAASLCNGGRGPGFLAPWVFKYLVGGLEEVIKILPAELPNTSVYFNIYKQLFAAQTDGDVAKTLQSDYDMLDAIGYRGNPAKANLKNRNNVLQSLFMKSKVEPLLPTLDAIVSGLSCYNMRDVIVNNKILFQPVFCPSTIFTWNHEDFMSILTPHFSEERSNKKNLETTTFKAFLDFAEMCYYDDQFPLSLGHLMKFISGSPTMPPLGLPSNVTVEFLHDCKPSVSGTACHCLPTVSTCSITLKLPVHIRSADEMQQSFGSALACEQGFGLI